MSKRGPAPKAGGRRRAITVRVPEEHWHALDAARREDGYESLSDFGVAIFAMRLGYDVPEYARRPKEAALPEAS